MKELTNNILFSGVSEKDINEILSVTPHSEKTYQDGENIILQGDIVNNIGIILQGEAVGTKYTLYGEEIIVSRMKKGRIFADVLSGAQGYASPVTVTAVLSCRVLFISYNDLLFSDNPRTHKVLQNMIKNISLKYFAQNRRMDILTRKSVREKIMTYLLWQSEEKGRDEFDIDLDRRLLANYLNVDRSALSRELSNMRKDNIIACRKNHFIILQK